MFHLLVSQQGPYKRQARVLVHYAEMYRERDSGQERGMKGIFSVLVRHHHFTLIIKNEPSNNIWVSTHVRTHTHSLTNSLTHICTHTMNYVNNDEWLISQKWKNA